MGQSPHAPAQAAQSAPASGGTQQDAIDGKDADVESENRRLLEENQKLKVENQKLQAENCILNVGKKNFMKMS